MKLLELKWSGALILLLSLSLTAGCADSPSEDDPGKTDAGVTEEDASPSDDASTPIPSVRSCTTEVVYEAAQSAGGVAVSGEFNGWDITANPMEREGDQWVTTLDLEPGEYAYKFVIDGEYEGQPPADVLTKWHEGVENRALVVGDCEQPMWEVVETSVGADGRIEATFAFVSAVSEAPVDADSIAVTVGDEPVEAEVDAEQGRVTVSYQAAEYGKYTIELEGSDTDGVAAENNPVWLPTWYEEEAFVWQDSLMYLIFTDRFLDSDGTSPVPPVEGVEPIANYMGGDFKGITEKIEEGYFEQLGVNLLWLSPIYENTDGGWLGADGYHRFTGYHGYWPTEALTSETRYGDAQASADERLKELIDAAHARGMRVLFDLVFNHVHEDHHYCSEHPTWCEITCNCGSAGCGWDEKPVVCQFAPYLPDLDYKNHAITQQMIDDTLALARKFDVDGFRVDAAKHMNHVIMRRLRHELEDLEADGAAEFYTVGETYTFTDGHGLIMNYVADHELHGQFDFPLLWPLRDTFAKDGSFRNLESAVATSEQQYGEFYEWMSPFLGNHDIPRFATIVADHLEPGTDKGPWGNTEDWMDLGPADEVSQWDIINRMSMAYAFLLTQPGIPLVYYGDEIGLAGSGDPDNRRMMDWEFSPNQQELFDRVAELGQARQQIDALRQEGRRELWVDDSFYVYTRGPSNGNAVIVAMNKGAQTRTETVTVPVEVGLEGRTLASHLSEREIAVDGNSVEITLDPWEYAIFVPK